MIHYIYRIDFLCGEPGRYYYGKRSYRGKDISKDKYAGSGDFCKNYYNKYGQIENKTYKKTIIEINYSFEENKTREFVIINDLWKTDKLCMNKCPGGGKIYPKTKPVIQYDLYGNIIRKYETIAKAEEMLGVFGIYDCCNGHNSCKTVGGFVWRHEGDSFNKYDTPKNKYDRCDKLKVNQYTLNGVFIKTWDSSKEAAMSVGKSNSKATIHKCANHKERTCYGFRWEWYNGSTENLPPMDKKTRRSIWQCDLSGNKIKEFSTFTDAARSVGKKYTEIIKRCAEGLQESAYGYKWKFDDNGN